MNDREKLVELLDILIQPGQKTLGDIADHLIAHGVTVQEWISVKDRLPKAKDTCYGYVLAIRTRHPHTVEVWKWKIVAGDPPCFTHWMPLPESPKEEKT